MNYHIAIVEALVDNNDYLVDMAVVIDRVLVDNLMVVDLSNKVVVVVHMVEYKEIVVDM